MTNASDSEALTRRGALAKAAALAGTTMILPASRLTAAPQRGGIPYGCAVRTGLLGEEPAYRDAILKYCSTVVPEGCLKWSDVRPTRADFLFGESDRFVRFARAHDLRIKGHNLVWGEANPAWVNEIARSDAHGVLVQHIETVVARYAGQIATWDVVNEPMSDRPTLVSDLRPSIWLRHLGPAYMDIAFRTAAAVDPTARLVINDYNIEYALTPYKTKREGFLDVIRGLRDRDVPLHAVGIQGHLRGDLAIDTTGLSTFVAAVKALGLDVDVTELDVIDSAIPDADHDAKVAALAETFLRAITDAARPSSILTWGITDKYTWIPQYFHRASGLPDRPLPLDAAYQEKPFMAVLTRYCR